MKILANKITASLTHFKPMFKLWKNQLPGFSLTGTLAGNGLTKEIKHNYLKSLIKH